MKKSQECPCCKCPETFTGKFHMPGASFSPKFIPEGNGKIIFSFQVAKVQIKNTILNSCTLCGCVWTVIDNRKLEKQISDKFDGDYKAELLSGFENINSDTPSCPRCSSTRLCVGSSSYAKPQFKLNNVKFICLENRNIPLSNECISCLDCGILRFQIDKDRYLNFLRKNGDSKAKKSIQRISDYSKSL